MQDYVLFETAVDVISEMRPGVPATRDPQPVGNAHWLEPAKQDPRPEVTKDVGRRELTATFGTGQPPRGLSGLIRRAAYGIPDYRAKRWALLLLADRVDSLETRASSVARHPVTWALCALGLGMWGASRLRSRGLLGR